jgi:hypothetical protein
MEWRSELQPIDTHLKLLRCVFLCERRLASSVDSGSRLPVLELPVHWPAAMSRRQLKNDDRCPQNNLTLLYTKKEKIIVPFSFHISALVHESIFLLYFNAYFNM